VSDEQAGWPEEFPESGTLAKYWGTDCLRVSGLPSVSDVMTIHDLIGLIGDSRARTPHLSMYMEGRPVEHRHYTSTRNIGGSLGTGFVNHVALRKLLADGASIKLSGLHDYWAPADRLRRHVQTCTGLSTAVAAILSPPGVGAFVLHQDVEHVFVLQTYGSKRWEVYRPFPGQATIGSVTKPEDVKPEHDIRLKAGDFFYVPSGWPHVATCTDEWSLHVTTSIRPILAAEVIRPQVEALLADLAMREVSAAPFGKPFDGAPTISAIVADLVRELEQTTWQARPMPPIPPNETDAELRELFGAGEPAKDSYFDLK
jgi:hypothetical protein